MRFTFCFNASVMTEGCPDLSASWTSFHPFLNIVHHFWTLVAFITCSPQTATSLRWISLGLTFSACKNWITPRTSQSAGFDIGAFIVTTRYIHNVKKFAAQTAPGNYLHSTEHTKWLICYNEITARVVCVNVLYFPNRPRPSLQDTIPYAVKISVLRSWGWAKDCPKHVELILEIHKLLLLHLVGFSISKPLTLILLRWRIWWAPNNARKYQMRFNSPF